MSAPASPSTGWNPPNPHTQEKPVTTTPTPRRRSRKASGPRITIPRRALTPRAES